jgi:hypothetical protein
VSAQTTTLIRRKSIRERWRAADAKTKLLLVVAAVLALGALHFAPLLWTHPEQDACTFGPVSNGRYRELLAEAERKQATEWPPLTWEWGSGQVLQERVDDLSRGLRSVYERLAAMHAVMRALGADYRRTGHEPPHDTGDIYERAQRGGGVVPFHYHLDVNLLHYFRPIRRQAWIIAGLAVKDADPPRPGPRELGPGDIFFTINWPQWLETYRIISRFALDKSCPRVPGPEWAEKLARTEK